ncbi:transposase [Colwellia sp. MB02u-6]|nr:transposase [Colwellia sp. MB02u-6]
MTKREKYSKEFKLDAIALIVEQNYSQAEASRNLGVNPNVRGRWLKEADNEDDQAFRSIYPSSTAKRLAPSVPPQCFLC